MLTKLENFFINFCDFVDFEVKVLVWRDQRLVEENCIEFGILVS